MILNRLRRALNPRYSWLPDSIRVPGARLIDVGAGPLDGKASKVYWPGSYMVGVNIEPEPDAGGFDEFYQVDLNEGDLSHLEKQSFDYAISSHRIEHLNDGMSIVSQMAELVRPGGLIYLEWPSERSLTFTIKGLGLRFDDDCTQVGTYS
jgi:SAM-dependent methyltransferase